MKFHAYVIPLTRRVHINTLRASNRSKNRYSSKNFTSVHSQTNSMKLEDCINNQFEANWSECKKKIKDFNAIFKYCDFFYRDRDNDNKDLGILFKQLGSDDRLDIKIICHHNNVSIPICPLQIYHVRC